MQHAEFRRLLGTDPKYSTPEVEAHRAACAECAKYADDMARLDRLVAGALAVPGPAKSAPPWEARRHPVRWYALAATVLIALGLGANYWFGQQRAELIVEVVKHADRERDVLIASDKRVDAGKIGKALAKAGAELTGDLPVSLARVCKIRGVVAPHLILQTRGGAVALLLLSKEQLWLPHSFVSQGYQGALVPMGSGHSIAVVGTDKEAVEEGARLASETIRWQPQ
jgi:hypothetical protein